jgi:protoporphyrinogen oxidase
MPDGELIALASRELTQLGVATRDDIAEGVVFRQRYAYPVYDDHYGGRVAVIRAFLDSLPNLQTIGRNGLHRYNNQDHSMLTGLLAAENVAGARHDVWSVNVERSYSEAAGPAGARRPTLTLPAG